MLSTLNLTFCVCLGVEKVCFVCDLGYSPTSLSVFILYFYVLFVFILITISSLERDSMSDQRKIPLNYSRVTIKSDHLLHMFHLKVVMCLTKPDTFSVIGGNLWWIWFIRSALHCTWKSDSYFSKAQSQGMFIWSWIKKGESRVIVLAWHCLPSALAFFSANKHTFNLCQNRGSAEIHHSPDDFFFPPGQLEKLRARRAPTPRNT